MKRLGMSHLAGLMGLAWMLSACTNVYFSEAVPASAPVLEEIPTTLQGRFVVDADTIWVEPNGYRTTENNSYRFERDAWEDSLRIEGDLAYWKNARFMGGHPFRKVEDTIWVDVHRRQFEPLTDQFICKRKGAYVFFSEQQDEGWVVAVARLDRKGRLIVKMIDEDKEEKLLKKHFDIEILPKGESRSSDKQLIDAQTADIMRYLKAGGFKEELVRANPDN